MSPEEMIARASQGDRAAIEKLVALIYPELKRRARGWMQRERTGHTFGPSGSELVQLTLQQVLARGGRVFQSVRTEQELIRLLSSHMRYILVDYARHRRKHGQPSPRNRVPFEDVQRFSPAVKIDHDAVLIVHEALEKLEALDAQGARALELRIFSGLTNAEAAASMGLNLTAFRRTLGFATGYLKDLLSAAAPGH